MGRKHRVNTWKDCMDPDNVDGFCKDHGAQFAGQSGSHCKWVNPENGQHIETTHHGNHHQHPTGTAHSIFSTLKSWGWVVLIIICAMGALYAAYMLGLC